MNEAIAFLTKHDACPFGFEFARTQNIQTVNEAYEKGDLMVVMFIVFKATKESHIFWQMAERLAGIQGLTTATENWLMCEIYAAKCAAEEAGDWNMRLANKLKDRRRRLIHKMSIQRLRMEYARRTCMFVMDFVHQQLFGEFNRDFSFQLGDIWREMMPSLPAVRS